jgi:hypothetical protein
MRRSIGADTLCDYSSFHFEKRAARISRELRHKLIVAPE